AGELDEHRERRIAFARLEIGDGRARHPRRSRQRFLGERARVTQADEIAREMRSDVIGCVHRFDFPPMCWTARLGAALRAPTMAPSKGEHTWQKRSTLPRAGLFIAIASPACAWRSPP